MSSGIISSKRGAGGEGFWPRRLAFVHGLAQASGWGLGPADLGLFFLSKNNNNPLPSTLLQKGLSSLTLCGQP